MLKDLLLAPSGSTATLAVGGGAAPAGGTNGETTGPADGGTGSNAGGGKADEGNPPTDRAGTSELPADPPPTGEEGGDVPELPDLGDYKILGKYGSISEAEKALREGSRTISEQGETIGNLNRQIEELSARAKPLDLDALQAEFSEAGQLSTETRGQLRERFGINDAVIDGIMGHLASVESARIEAFDDLTDGNWSAIQEWASKLHPEDSEFDVVSAAASVINDPTADEAAKEAAVIRVNRLYAKLPRRSLRTGETTTGVDGFESRADFNAACASMPTSDPSAVRAWAKQIAAKYNASNWANDKMDWRDLVRG
jgi:hypothetical protein